MKIDPAMLKMINSAIDTSLKKNKDLKAATDVEKTVDNYVKKNKIGLDNAREVTALKSEIKRLTKALQDSQKKVDKLDRKVAQLDRETSWNINYLNDQITSLKKEMSRSR